MVRKERLLRLIRQLIKLDSQNPPGDEREIALFVKAYLEKIGMEARVYEFKKRRSNVVAVWGGENKQHSLLITPHLDTVPAGKNWRHGPFSGKLCKDKIYGLGATDCKGNLASLLEALQSLTEENTVLPYTLIFAATADEESGSEQGLIPLLTKGILAPSAAVVLDASDFDIIVTQKGLVHLKVKVQGKRAHGAYPYRGKNAIDMSLRVLDEVKRYKFEYRRSPLLKCPTVNIGTIRGGDKVNIVADWCEFELDYRFLPQMSQQKILRDLKAMLRRHAWKFKVEIEGIQKPYCIDTGHPLVASLVAAMKKCHIRPHIRGSEGATVITFFQDKGIPAVATGFGAEACAHIADEYARLSWLYKGAEALVEFLTHYNATKEE
jgi:acetylornithine deacetylase/succinyl-diaminopimelate desuccinylase family protein